MSNLLKVVLICIAVVLFTGIGSTALFLNSSQENKRMDTTNRGIGNVTPIPPLDASVPARTETATFALG